MRKNPMGGPDRIRATSHAKSLLLLRESFGRAGAELPDTPGMWFDEDRTDVSDWLQGHGWTVELIEILDLMARYERGVTEEEAAGIPACDCISRRLN